MWWYSCVYLSPMHERHNTLYMIWCREETKTVAVMWRNASKYTKAFYLVEFTPVLIPRFDIYLVMLISKSNGDLSSPPSSYLLIPSRRLRYDRVLALLDARAPTKVSAHKLEADPECLLWNPHNPAQVSCGRRLSILTLATWLPGGWPIRTRSTAVLRYVTLGHGQLLFQRCVSSLANGTALVNNDETNGGGDSYSSLFSTWLIH